MIKKVVSGGQSGVDQAALDKDGDIGPQIGIYRDADDGPCEICMLHEKTWKDRMTDEMLVFNSKFKVEFQ